MQTDLVEIISGLFKGLDTGRRWLVLSLILGSLVLALVVFDYHTGYSYYNSLDRKVALVKELNALTEDGVDARPELQRLYGELVEEVSRRRVYPLMLPTLATSVPFWKGMSAASLWLLLIIPALLGTFGQSNRVAGVVLMLFLAALAGLLGSLVPTIYRPVVNYLLYPTAQFGFLLWSGRRMRSRQAGEAAPSADKHAKPRK
jgi:hypothetical protein